MEFSDAIEAYEQLEPRLRLLKQQLKTDLEGLVFDLGLVEAKVKGRVKTAHSFAAKLYEKGEKYQPDPLARMRDKVGLRVEVLLPQDRDALVMALERGDLPGLEHVDSDDKGEGLAVTTFGYNGVNIDCLPSGYIDETVPAEHAWCEIQVRTQAAGTWSVLSHMLYYKPILQLGPEQSRRLFRLAAIVEMFDEEAQRLRDEVMADARYPVAALIAALVRERTRLRREPSQQPELTERLVTELLGPQDASAVAAQLSEWVIDNRDKLLEVLGRYEGSGRMFLVDRPEGLLAFHLLDENLFSTWENWRDHGHDERVIEDFAEAWGAHLPAS